MTRMISSDEILEGNKLMARFLGYDYYGHNDPRLIPESVPGSSPFPQYPAGWKTHSQASNFTKLNKISHWNHKEMKYLCRNHWHLRYFNAWDGWLWEVINKIESFHLHIQIETYSSDIKWMGTEDADYPWLEMVPDGLGWYLDNKELSRTQRTWMICLEFIKWYNEHAQDKEIKMD